MITQETSDEARGEQEMITRQLRIEEQQFQLELESNEAVDALLQALPISVSMTDLNQNEKYMYLSDSLPMAPEKVGRIEKGDVLLFGSDCFVIFYKGFDTEYSYTRIGKIKDADALEFLENTETIKIHLE
ncbi:cyclophilin-like fold protein [Enterococcus larvae]|nr:cyclophilin-like fold protein [Enterococcus larvae]